MQQFGSSINKTHFKYIYIYYICRIAKWTIKSTLFHWTRFRVAQWDCVPSFKWNQRGKIEKWCETCSYLSNIFESFSLQNLLIFSSGTAASEYCLCIGIELSATNELNEALSMSLFVLCREFYDFPESDAFSRI